MRGEVPLFLSYLQAASAYSLSIRAAGHTHSGQKWRKYGARKIGDTCTMKAQKLWGESSALAVLRYRSEHAARTHYCMRIGLPLYRCTTRSWSRPTMSTGSVAKSVQAAGAAAPQERARTAQVFVGAIHGAVGVVCAERQALVEHRERAEVCNAAVVVDHALVVLRVR